MCLVLLGYRSSVVAIGSELRLYLHWSRMHWNSQPLALLCMLSLEPTELYFCLLAKDRYELGAYDALLVARAASSSSSEEDGVALHIAPAPVTRLVNR